MHAYTGFDTVSMFVGMGKLSAQRADYQAAIWKRSLQMEPAAPSPNGIGWRWDTHDAHMQLAVDWMQGQPTPQAVLDFLACTCYNSCKLPKCVCMASGLKCTDMYM